MLREHWLPGQSASQLTFLMNGCCSAQPARSQRYLLRVDPTQRAHDETALCDEPYIMSMWRAGDNVLARMSFMGRKLSCISSPPCQVEIPSWMTIYLTWTSLLSVLVKLVLVSGTLNNSHPQTLLHHRDKSANRPVRITLIMIWKSTGLIIIILL